MSTTYNVISSGRETVLNCSCIVALTSGARRHRQHLMEVEAHLKTHTTVMERRGQSTMSLRYVA